MKIKSLATLFALFLAQSTFALSSAPQACPDVAAIRSVGVSQASNVMGGWIAMSERNYYGTSEEWSFAMLLGPADNESDALSQAAEQLKSLSLVEGPSKDDRDEWGCVYTSRGDGDTGFMSVAVTPPVAFTSQMILKYKK